MPKIPSYVFHYFNANFDIKENNEIFRGKQITAFAGIAFPEKFFIYSDGSFAFKINGPNNKDSLDGYIVRLLNEDKKNK